MKFNKWTLGLAAVGLVSLASAVKAEEAATPILTALSSTTISGYVDVSAQWNPGTGNVGPAFANAAGKRDGFNVDSVLISLEKPLQEGEWSAGYRVDLMYGPDAGGVAPGNVRQAYVALRAPLGNGLDMKLGRWDSIIGYESTDTYKNPNFTHSYAYTLLVPEFTGLLATYQVVDWLSVNAGVANANAFGGGINDNFGGFRNPRGIESAKAYMGSATVIVPDSWGFLAGSALYAGVIDGPGNTIAGLKTSDRTDYYVGATFATGVEGLKVGAAYNFFDNPGGKGTDTYAVALYGSFKWEKFGFHLRGEYVDTAANFGGAPVAINGGVATEKLLAVTGTLQYDIWENVLSRLEVRWDHDLSASQPRPWNGHRNDFLVAANLVYKF